MHERLFLVKKLRQLLLGPAGGALEVLPVGSDPRDEYLTGVLAPWMPPEGGDPSPERDIEAEADLLGGEESGEEDDEPEVFADPGFSTALDPRSLPPSIGLTFLVGGLTPTLSLCVTGARYRLSEEERWQRCPFGWASEELPVEVGRRRFFIDEPEVEVQMRTTEKAPGVFRVTIFLTNLAPPPGKDRQAPAPSLVFQPQIRVAFGEGSSAVSLLDLEPEGGAEGTDADASLRLLYRDAAVRGRGHLCGAVWREIDPESEDETDAWFWVDRESCPPAVRDRFVRPDLRTDFLPSTALSSPSLEWRQEYGVEPVREALSLSECFESRKIEEALEPLLLAYQSWLDEQKSASVPARFAAIAAEHIRLCENSLDRMRSGLRRLVEDEQSRLAFCFANRAMAEQALWRDPNRPLQWRAFQLGFMLQCLEGLADSESEDREICDLLWFPTGGGKTEAYLGLTAFVMALRRLREPDSGGTAVISRYTLRLLAIQQFRRAMRLVTACEVLRVQPRSKSHGWCPEGYSGPDWLWGRQRFSIGLWVGGGVTPNKLESSHPSAPGAFELLRRASSGHGEPAQVLECPACEAILAVPRAGQERQEQAAFPAGAAGVLHLVVDSEQLSPVNPTDLSTDRIQIDTVEPRSMPAAGYHTVSVSFTALAGVSAEDLDRWYSDRLEPALGRWVRLVCARPSRPGYFVRPATNPRGQEKDWSIEIYCPAPDCPLSGLPWREQVPVPLGVRKPPSCDGWQQVFTPYRSQKDETIGIRVPIPAVMVDEQIYSWPPTLLVSTVDKFARLPYEPRAASLFGQVELYHPREGYYRQHCVREKGRDHPTFPDLRREVKPLRPPDLILQDELHLIDGPLGSMMGIYETAVDVLCSRLARPKYIASTATVREAREQVQALFARSLTQFPAPGLSASDSFFALVRPGDPRQEAGSGRLYLGFLAPAKGALTPIVRLWAILLQSTAWLENMGVETDSLDPYWTTVGYFNAVRELAGVTGLLRQDVPQWRNHLEPREREEIDEPVELSSRMDSQRLPASLARLERPYPDAERAVLATSMFGTGVDVPRLSLMIVHGQPKTTSAYIQATGRVGRAAPGLIVTAFRASRPRDLDHYEFFTGYHGQLYRGVEPVTVFPFSPRARERALGPLCVALLRNAGELAGRPVSSHWCREPGGATHMVQGRVSDEVAVLASIFERRSKAQPDNRQPSEQAVQREVEAALDLWRQLAQNQSGLQYVEYCLDNRPTCPVVLGDMQHVQARLGVAFPRSPQSLRDVEATTGFKT